MVRVGVSVDVAEKEAGREEGEGGEVREEEMERAGEGEGEELEELRGEGTCCSMMIFSKSCVAFWLISDDSKHPMKERQVCKKEEE